MSRRKGARTPFAFYRIEELRCIHVDNARGSIRNLFLCVNDRSNLRYWRRRYRQARARCHRALSSGDNQLPIRLHRALHDALLRLVGASMPGLGWGTPCLGMLGAFRRMLASCGSGWLSVWLLWWGSRGGRFSVSGGRRKGLHDLGMAAVLRHWKNACLCGLLDVHQKIALGVCC